MIHRSITRLILAISVLMFTAYPQISQAQETPPTEEQENPVTEEGNEDPDSPGDTKPDDKETGETPGETTEGEKPEEEQEDKPPPRAKIVVKDDRPANTAPARGPAPPREVTGDPKKDLLEYANLLYRYKKYDLAIRQYKKYINTYPGSSPEAYYRLGESHLQAKQGEEAERIFQAMLRRFDRGEFVGAAAYRLAYMNYVMKNYATAAPYFATAQRESSTEQVRLSSGYYRGRALQFLGKTEDAIAAYQSIVDAGQDTAYHDPALIALARLDISAGRNEEAKTKLNYLRENSVIPKIRAEAGAKTGHLLATVDDVESNRVFEEVLSMEGEDVQEWRASAHYGLMSNLYRHENHDGVIATFGAHKVIHKPDTEGRTLILLGNAYRKKKKLDDAVNVYTIAERKYTERIEGQEASYRKLLCLYEQNHPDLPRYVDSYLEIQKRLGAEHRFKHLATLLKAEKLFADRKYPAAASAYTTLDMNQIPEEMHASVLYKTGWALHGSKQYDKAATKLTTFLTSYPDHEDVPKALAKRADCYNKQEIYGDAVNDYQRIIKNFPDSELAELSMQQIAFVRGAQQDIDGMIEGFENLLKTYPQTKGASAAYYWMGWGHFKNKAYAKAVPNLAKARELNINAKKFEQASLWIIIAYFRQRDLENTAAEVNTLTAKNPKANIPIDILGWLGSEYFDRSDHTRAGKYLVRAVDWKEPAKTRVYLWDRLGRSHLQNAQYQEALKVFDIYLEQVKEEPALRAKALLNKGTALRKLKKFAAADDCAKEVLRLEKEGRINAFAWLLLGDVAMARKEYEEAQKCYIMPARMFRDQQVTPIAMDRLATAFDQLGKQGDAEKWRATLRKNYPAYRRSNAPVEPVDDAASVGQDGEPDPGIDEATVNQGGPQ